MHFRDSPDSLNELWIPGNILFRRFAVTYIYNRISSWFIFYGIFSNFIHTALMRFDRTKILSFDIYFVSQTTYSWKHKICIKTLNIPKRQYSMTIKVDIYRPLFSYAQYNMTINSNNINLYRPLFSHSQYNMATKINYVNIHRHIYIFYPGLRSR